VAKEGFRRYVRRDPLGIVLTIAPWNYPYLTAVNSIVPALMAGNAVLLKHATQTILVGDRFQAAMDRAGFPKGLFQNLVLSHDDTLKLIGSGQIDQVCFTGSVASGRTIEQAAAGTFAGVGLELGGKDPGLCAQRRRSRACGGESGRRQLLQFRAMLLRHRAHLCAG
jgi:NAD-dependent aldehyde dehydrogenases